MDDLTSIKQVTHLGQLFNIGGQSPMGLQKSLARLSNPWWVNPSTIYKVQVTLQIGPKG